MKTCAFKGCLMMCPFTMAGSESQDGSLIYVQLK